MAKPESDKRVDFGYASPAPLGMNSRELDQEVSERIEQRVFGALDPDQRIEEMKAITFRDPVYRNLLINNEVERVKREITRELTNTKIVINVPMSADQWSQFSSKVRLYYPTYRVVHKPSGKASAHPVLRAFRVIERAFLFDVLAHIPNRSLARPPLGYEVAWKEIGGRKELLLKEAAIHGHSCNPVLDAVDAIRDQEAALAIALDTSADLARKHVRARLERADPILCCSRPAQDCDIKAPVLLAVHATYDMHLEHVADAMIKSSATVFYGVTKWHRIVEQLDEGVLPGGEMRFQRLDVNGRPRIAFYYPDDNQPAYHHDLLNYLNFHRQTAFTRQGQSFLVKHDYYEPLSTMYTTIHRYAGGGVPSSVLVHMPQSSLIDKYVLVYSYKWVELPDDSSFSLRNIFSSADSRWMHLRRSVYDKVLWDDVCAAITCLQEKNFDLPHAFRVAIAINGRQFVSGQPKARSNTLGYRDVMALAVDAYYEVYRVRRDNTCAVSLLIQDEKELRAFASGNLLRAWFCKLPTYLANMLFGAAPQDAVSSVTRPNLTTLDSNEAVEYQLKASAGIHQVVSAYRRYNAVAATKMPSLLVAWAEEIPAMCGTRSNVVVPDPATVFDYLPQDAIVALNTSISTSIAGVGIDSFVPTTCTTEHLVRRSNTGRGQCVYMALVQAGIICDSYAQYLERLQHSVHLCKMRDPERILSTVNTGTPHADLLALIALEYALLLCVHRDGVTTRYGSGQLLHLHWDGQHVEWLTTEVCAPIPRFSIKLNSACPTAHRELGAQTEVDRAFKRINECAARYNANHPRVRDGDFYRAVKKRIFPYDIRKRNILVRARSYFKTAELLACKGVSMSSFRNALSIGGPGSEAALLRCSGVAPVFGITKVGVGYKNFDDALLHDAAFIPLLGQSGDGDILDMQNLLSFTAHIRTVCPFGIDFFGGDAAPTDPGEHTDAQRAGQLILAQAHLAAGLVSRQGCGYIKMFDLDQQDCLDAVNVIVQAFKDVEVIKLQSTTDGSNEFHLWFAHRENSDRTISNGVLAHIANQLDDIWVRDIYNIASASVVAVSTLDGVRKYSRNPDPGTVALIDSLPTTFTSAVGLNLSQYYETFIRRFSDIARNIANEWYGFDHADPSSLTLSAFARLVNLSTAADDSTSYVTAVDPLLPPSIDHSVDGAAIEHPVDVIVQDVRAVCDDDSVSDDCTVVNFNVNDHIDNLRVSHDTQLSDDIEHNDARVPIANSLDDLCSIESSVDDGLPVRVPKKPLFRRCWNTSKRVYTAASMKLVDQVLHTRLTRRMSEFRHRHAGIPVRTGKVRADLAKKSLATQLFGRARVPDNSSKFAMDLKSNRDLPVLDSPHKVNYPVFNPANAPGPTIDPGKHMQEFMNYQYAFHSIGIKDCTALWSYIGKPTLNTVFLQHKTCPCAIIRQGDGVHYTYEHPKRAEHYRHVFIIDSNNQPKLVKWDDFPQYPVGQVGIVNNFTEHGHALQIAERCRALAALAIPQSVFSDRESGIIQSGPGCGKTHTMVTNLRANDLAIVHSEKAADEVRQRILLRRPDLGRKFSNTRVKMSIAALFTPTGLHVDTLHIDEALQFHSGEIVSLIVLTQPRHILMYGDRKQPDFHCEIGAFITTNYRIDELFGTIKYLTHSYRCDSSVVYRLNRIYADVLPPGVHMTAQRFSANSCSTVKISSLNEVPHSSNAVYLAFTTEELRQLKHAGYTPCFTIRQYQGGEDKNISVIRTNCYPQSTMFSDEALCVVALSRHTNSLHYYSVIPGDMLWNLIEWNSNRPSENELNELVQFRTV